MVEWNKYTKLRPSADIPSGAVAQSLCSQLGDNPNLDGHHTYMDMRFTLRLCRRGIEPSGGILLLCWINRDTDFISPDFRNPIKVYIRRGWNEKRVASKVIQLMHWARNNRTLWLKRQELHKLCGQYAVPEGFTPPDGREDSYGLMDDEDVWFWKKYIVKHFKRK